jgi:hypothetical protein
MTSFKAGRPKTILYSERHAPGAQTSQLHNNSTNNAISHPSVIVNNFVSGDVAEITRENLAAPMHTITDEIGRAHV